jgi:hypothetical protein
MHLTFIWKCPVQILAGISTALTEILDISFELLQKMLKELSNYAPTTSLHILQLIIH